MILFDIIITFNCNKCGAPVEKDGESSETIVCDFCDTEYNVALDVSITQK